jgi:hypothetical protein
VSLHDVPECATLDLTHAHAGTLKTQRALWSKGLPPKLEVCENTQPSAVCAVCVGHCVLYAGIWAGVVFAQLEAGTEPHNLTCCACWVLAGVLQAPCSVLRCLREWAGHRQTLVLR